MSAKSRMYTLCCSVCLWIAGCTHGAPIRDLPAHAVANRMVEFTFADAGQLAARFIGPSGQLLAMRSFADGNTQRIRFTPTEHGSWEYVVSSPTRILVRASLEVVPGTHPGFVRVNGRGYVHADGTPLLVIGENRINIYDPAWNWNRLPVRDYLRHMADHGMTVLRVFIVSDIENEEQGGRNAGVLEPEVGVFDAEVARQFDEIFRAAEEHGIYIVLVAFALGFSEDDAWKSWHDNPYSTARGGHAATRYDFFESSEVHAQAAGRVRYLAARYAAAPNLLAIDLLNEPEWDGGIPEVSWAAWAARMSQVWDDADPYEHPVTVGSVGLHWNIEGDERDWWASDACDIVQWHLYGKEVYDVHALAREISRKVAETDDFGKPVLLGEFAYGGESKPEYDHTHVGLWAAVFSGAGVLAHSAPPFNIDSDELMTPARARHFRVLTDFFAALPPLEPRSITISKPEFGAWALWSGNIGTLWLLAPADNYGQPVSGATVNVGDVTGRWRVQWIDDVTGAVLAVDTATSNQGALALTAPTFARHIAAKLERL